MKKITVLLIAILVISSIIATGCSPPAPSPTPAPASSPASSPKPSPTSAPTPSASPAPAAKKAIELKLVNYMPIVYPNNIFTTMFADAVAAGVKAKAPGELVVTTVGGPEVIPIPDQGAAVKRGSIDMSSALYSVIASVAPGVKALNAAEITPMEIRSVGAYDYIQTICAKNGIYYLGASSPSPPQEQVHWYLNKKVEKIADFKGLKLAGPSPTYHPFALALGAVGVTVSFADYYTAMERGTVDGYNYAEQGVANTLEKVTKYQLEPGYGSAGSGFIINLDTWNKLPKNLQDIMNQAAIEVDTKGVQKWQDVVNGELHVIMQKNGLQFINLLPDEVPKFRTAYRDLIWGELLKELPTEHGKLKELIVKK